MKINRRRIIVENDKFVNAEGMTTPVHLGGQLG